MKRVIIKSCLLFCALALAGAGAAARAQGAKLQLDDLERLATRANGIVDVNLPSEILSLIPNVKIKDDDGKEWNTKELILGLRGIFVRSYEFKAENEFGDAEVSGIRTQLRNPGWIRFVNVLNRDDRRSVEVYMMAANGRFDGLAVLATEPKRLTVVNIVGTIDIEKLTKLEGQFGIPELGIDKDDVKEEKPAGTTKKP